MEKYKPSQAFSTRLATAKTWRTHVQKDISEAMRFCAPPRANDFNLDTMKHAEVDTFISIMEEMATDLAGDLVNYYMPSEQKWGEYEVTQPVGADIAEQVEALVNQREQQLFDLIDASNLNDLKPQIMFEAATHGTPAIWVNQGHIQDPIFMEVVPPNELLITPGRLGILDRFREYKVPAATLELDIPYATFDDPALRKKMDKPGQTAKVCFGYWVDWSDPGNPIWMHEVTVDDKRVTDKEMPWGPLAGACPLLVGRFNPQPHRPWGRGPAIKALPDALTLNKIQEVQTEKLDELLDPAWTYVDDSVLDLSLGIQAGHAYPRRSEQVPTPLYAGGAMDYGFRTLEQYEQSIRVAFYQDGPRQRGETPPTASQWIDERRRVQSRLGKPSAPLWTELLVPLIQRTEFLAVQMGMMQEAITLNERVINVTPISPLQRSQNQDKAMTARSNLDLGVAVFGDQFGQVVDPVATFKNIVQATGDELTVVNSEMPNEAETPPA